MAWRAILEADVLTVLSAPELAGYRAAALKSGQADPVAPSIAQVTDLVRGFIAGWAANTLGEDGTIPTKLLQPSLDLLAVIIPRRAAGKNPTESREDAYAEAMKILRDVSAGRFRIDEPVVATDEKIAILAPTIGRPKHRRGRVYREGA